VANKLRILRHSDAVLAALREGNLTERHARALLRLSSEDSKLAAIAEIIRQGMSVARAEKYIESLLISPKKPPEKSDVSSFLNNLTQSLQKIQRSGVGAVSERRETDTQIVLTITIPK
jgi:ParB family chromosome partitioning protein